MPGSGLGTARLAGALWIGIAAARGRDGLLYATFVFAAGPPR